MDQFQIQDYYERCVVRLLHPKQDSDIGEALEGFSFVVDKLSNIIDGGNTTIRQYCLALHNIYGRTFKSSNNWEKQFQRSISGDRMPPIQARLDRLKALYTRYPQYMKAEIEQWVD